MSRIISGGFDLVYKCGNHVHYGDTVELHNNLYQVKSYVKHTSWVTGEWERSKKLKCCIDQRYEHVDLDEATFVKHSSKGAMICKILDMDDDEFEKVKLLKSIKMKYVD
jgi:hypothetical protein